VPSKLVFAIMRCQKIVVVASLLAAGSQAYAPIQMTTGPAKGLVVLPKGFPGNIKGTMTPQKLSVGNPTASDSPSMTPYFTAKLDQSISWDDMDWCLEAMGDKNGDAVRVNQCTGETVQKWSWIPDGHGSNRIQLQNTNLCMDANAKEFLQNRAPIELRDCAQEVTAWKFEDMIPLPTESANDSLSYEGRHVLITLMTLAGLGIVSAGAYLWEKKHQVPAAMIVNPTQPSVPARASRTTDPAMYTVTLDDPDLGTVSFECAEDEYMIDAAEDNDIEMPYSCRSGACSTCAGKIVEGTVDQSEGNFLDEDQIADNFVLTCIAYPTSDVTIKTHQEEDLFG